MPELAFKSTMPQQGAHAEALGLRIVSKVNSCPADAPQSEQDDAAATCIMLVDCMLLHHVANMPTSGWTVYTSGHTVP